MAARLGEPFVRDVSKVTDDEMRAEAVTTRLARSFSKFVTAFSRFGVAIRYETPILPTAKNHGDH